MEQKKQKIPSRAPEGEDVWMAGGPAWINLANTIALANKGLADVTSSADEFRGWLSKMGNTAPSNLTSEDLAFSKELRRAFFRVFEAIDRNVPIAAKDLEVFNAILANQHTWYVLDQQENGAIVKSPRRSADTIEQVLGPLVESLSETLVYGDLTRLRTCAHPECELRFYDDSKNGARRWCTMSGCGNRAKAAAFLQRKKTRA